MNIRNNDNFELLKENLTLTGYNEHYIDIDDDGDMTIYAVHVSGTIKIDLSCHLDQVMSSDKVDALTVDEADVAKNLTVLDILEYLEDFLERD